MHPRRRPGGGLWRVFLGALSVALAATMAPLPTAHAALLTVNTLLDNTTEGDGLCTLREAITAANNNANYHDCMAAGYGNETITFGVSGTISLGSQLPDIHNAGRLTIDGTGQDVTISGNNAVRVFALNNMGASLTLEYVTIANGSSDFGGGILNSGMLTVSHCVLLDNHATGSGGGLRNQSIGTVTLTQSEFLGNSATGFGGGLANYGTLTVTHSQFTGNTASQGGGLSTTMSDAVSVANCTFSDNNAIDGAGLNVYGGTAVVTNCTFSGNTATGGDGAGIHVGGTVTVTNSTLSGNRWGIYSNGNATVRNTIVANSTFVNCGVSDVGTITNGGNNLDDGTTCGWGSTNGSMSSTNPQLGALADNGGPTQTMVLLEGSPAIDGVTWNAPNDCPATDQRGVRRPLGAHCDIGAYEKGSVVLLPLVMRNHP